MCVLAVSFISDWRSMQNVLITIQMICISMVCCGNESVHCFVRTSDSFSWICVVFFLFSVLFRYYLSKKLFYRIFNIAATGCWFFHFKSCSSSVLHSISFQFLAILVFGAISSALPFPPGSGSGGDFSSGPGAGPDLGSLVGGQLGLDAGGGYGGGGPPGGGGWAQGGGGGGGGWAQGGGGGGGFGGAGGGFGGIGGGGGGGYGGGGGDFSSSGGGAASGGGYDYTPSQGPEPEHHEEHHEHHEEHHHHPEPPKGRWEKKLEWKEEWVKVHKTEKKQSFETKWKSVSVPVWKEFEVPVWKEQKTPETKIIKKQVYCLMVIYSISNIYCSIS